MKVTILGGGNFTHDEAGFGRLTALSMNLLLFNEGYVSLQVVGWSYV
jgi:hypothetical protein